MTLPHVEKWPKLMLSIHHMWILGWAGVEPVEAATLYLCWDKEGSEKTEDSALDTIFKAVDASKERGSDSESSSCSRRKKRKNRKSKKARGKKAKKGKKKVTSSSESESESSEESSSESSSTSSGGKARQKTWWVEFGAITACMHAHKINYIMCFTLASQPMHF